VYHHGLLATFVALVVMAAGIVVGAPPATAAPMTWRLAPDLLANATSAAPTNPFADSYGHSSTWRMVGSPGLLRDPSTYGLLTSLSPNTCGVTGFAAWSSSVFVASTYSNTTGSTISGMGCAPYQVLPSHGAFAHPGPSNVVAYGWTSPVSGTVLVSGSVADADCGGGNGINWYVDSGAVDVASGSLLNCGSQPFPSDLLVPVHTGDVLYFVIDPKGEYSYDQTQLDVTIQQTDTTAPIIEGSVTPAPNANGWNDTPVTVAFTCTDADSGVASCPSSTVLPDDGADQTVTGTAFDGVGNQASTTVGPIDIDQAPPIVTVSVPADGTSYVVGQTVAAAYSCFDALSGVDTCDGLVPVGEAVDTSSPGPATFVATAEDRAGNVSTTTVTYVVTAPATNLATVTSVASSANPSELNATVTFTATVSAAAGTPDGTVQWQADGTNLGVPVPLDANGTAQWSTSTLTVTNTIVHQITAVYSGSVGFDGSAGTLAQAVAYAADGVCVGAPGHRILQPVNADGTSVFKSRSTVGAKFRVCDTNGMSLGTPGVVASFRLTQTIDGTAVANVDEAVDSSTPDSAFRWDQGSQQWIFNISTKNLAIGKTYVYEITLGDGSVIHFRFGMR
jgi:hypothetical protein